MRRCARGRRWYVIQGGGNDGRGSTAVQALEGIMGRASAVVVAALLVAAAPKAAVAQGWIEPDGPTVVRSAVDKVRSEVRVRLEGRVAQVEVSEWFRNDGERVAQGDYLYPLPGEAVFQGFSLFQGDAELRGEIMDAARARAIYEEIVRRRADPALIELAGHGLLRARVFPIEPGQERKVTLRYTQVLARAGKAVQLAYAGGVRGASGAGPGAAVETLFEVVVEDGDAYLDPFSPTHALGVNRHGGRLTVRLEEDLSGRLSIFFPVAGEAVGVSLATHRPAGEDGYFMLTLSPGRNTERAEPRDVTVVLDVSGSMSGEKIEQARSALRSLLETLGRDDRFRLLAFSSAVHMESAEWRHATGAQLARARAWVDDLVADGGTNMGEALDEAFRLESPSERLPVVIFLTDGLPSVGEQSPERLADRAEERAGRARVFTFGVGHDVNTHLLDRLGEAGRGTTAYVEPGENVERVISLLAAKIRHPVLTDLEVAGAPVRLEEIYPVRLPDVFAGEDLVLFGRYRADGTGTLRLRGRRGGSVVTFTAEASFPERTDANGFIPRLWASRKLGHLTRQIWTEGETASLVDEIRTLALRYGLPSRYTSYLVQEPTTLAVGGGRNVWPAGPRGVMAPAVVPTAMAATGASAVRMAEEARRMRDASTKAGLAEAEADMMSRVDIDDGRPARMIGGRIFHLDGGVWKDDLHRVDQDIVRVKAFSSAYFQLVARVEELRTVVAELSPVLVAGVDLSFQVGDEGLEGVDARRLDDLVKRFRGGAGTP
ncbi:MAG TPA: VWA domain-containing protein [Longimicrobiales bacterium]|nr:VWA domain-containing protein [Longimicrobiales bacterium]